MKRPCLFVYVISSIHELKQRFYFVVETKSCKQGFKLARLCIP
jgi:hypothetical protein